MSAHTEIATNVGYLPNLNERRLSEAFEAFVRTAGILEVSYRDLQCEVGKLRCDLEQTNGELTRSLEENQRMRAHLHRILDGLPCAVMVFDSRSELTLRNPEADRLLATGHQGRDQARREMLAGCLQDPAGSERELVLHTDADPQYVAVKRADLPATEAKDAGSVLIIRDITEQRRLEQEREVSRRMQALADTSALLAHEIRNPLASLELFAGLLAESTEPDSEPRQWVDHIQAGLRMLAATVNNVLHLRNQVRPQLRLIDLRELLELTLELLLPIARQQHIRIEFLPELDEAMMLGDEHRLQQVFFNLAVNAFRAMRLGHMLQVRLGKNSERSKLLVEVKDEGCGITPENLDRIFEPGFSGIPGSAGLGLAVCKKIVEQHSGTIAVRSEPGAGTTFSLMFPLTGEAA